MIEKCRFNLSFFHKGGWGVPKQSKMCIKMYNILMEREGGRPNLIVLNHFLPRLRVRNLPKMHQKLQNMGL